MLLLSTARSRQLKTRHSIAVDWQVFCSGVSSQMQPEVFVVHTDEIDTNLHKYIVIHFYYNTFLYIVQLSNTGCRWILRFYCRLNVR